MEFVVAKQRRKYRKKRRLKKRLRERTKHEVRFVRHTRIFSNITDARETLAIGTMQADAFWKNYAVAQEWQKRHSITWWRSRCVALEHENQVLRDKVRFLARYRGSNVRTYDHCTKGNTQKNQSTEPDTNNEDLEFTVNEDMLNFFETSERHKREIQRERGSDRIVSMNSEETAFVGAAERIQMRKEEADLLYGDAGSKILAMETALQSTVERYEDTANPQYWPNIPLKP